MNVNSNRRRAPSMKQRLKRRRLRPPAGGEVKTGQAARSNVDWRSVFPRLAGPQGRFGVGLMLAVAKREGTGGLVRFTRLEQAFDGPGRRPMGRVLSNLDHRRLSVLLGGLAHADRLRIAAAILTGANSHRLLKEEIRIKTGPLYHHLRELERGGIVSQPSRNFYTLSEQGEVALLIATGLASGKGSRGWRQDRIGPARPANNAT